MTIDLICQREVDTASKLEDVHTAAQRMESRNVGSLVVLDELGCPVGILTDRDLALRVIGQRRNPEEAVVGDVMTHDPTCVPAETSVDEALTTMLTEGVRRLPVLDGDGRMSGMVSLDDIVGHLARDLGHVRALIQETSPSVLAGA